MEPSRVNRPGFWIANLTCIVALLLGVAAFSPPSRADGARARAHGNRADGTARVARRGVVVERQNIVVEPHASPEAATGGTVVLRGSRSGIPSAGPNAGQRTSPANGEGYGSSQPPAWAIRPTPGWDRELDTGGLDYGAPAYPLNGALGMGY